MDFLCFQAVWEAEMEIRDHSIHFGRVWSLMIFFGRLRRPLGTIPPKGLLHQNPKISSASFLDPIFSPPSGAILAKKTMISDEICMFFLLFSAPQANFFDIFHSKNEFSFTFRLTFLKSILFFGST